MSSDFFISILSFSGRSESFPLIFSEPVSKTLSPFYSSLQNRVPFILNPISVLKQNFGHPVV
ncbi:hypothetical protein LEP1GSC171_1348 [Leptospira santarosai str. HAI1380]|uniref:Uncharacterized protein n=1 Tax=Leptospira santarosai serovar Arenal str. MAVJ 401 TaxID=1049976 RepID=M6JIB1_9LEPT|nr:hypothetical protein LEP1GSC063_4079 [Leptospira santarosai serovar Arenal str. MAVJ 401]EMO23037.1 hypothetical protein LEP1GSC168_0511 [Leptospira santarosai str. HAI134]EMO83881.1 hypothetical protein LEP1GSC070_0706 [Leptospira santarosai str. AIM]EMP01556.1 hypothetical protein LEP1GSC171_1348 [Leptospira santarosai str. HAI1380]